MQEYKYETLIENIKFLISEKGIKQRVAAERSGFTPQEFSNMLNYRRKLLRVEHLPSISVRELSVTRLIKEGLLTKEVSKLMSKVFLLTGGSP